MDCKDRNGIVVATDNSQDKLLKKLYGNVLGRSLLKVITLPAISKLAGFLLDTKFSCCLINSFIKNNNIDMSEYVEREYKSYNDFFTREIKKENRVIDNNSQILISPSDGRVSIYDIDEDSDFCIKDTLYNVETITNSKKAAKLYKGGKFVIIRLCVDNYHRYCYIDNGRKTKNKFIKGVLHTVNPIANDYFEIYKENSRECSVLYTENFGRVMQIEVGALMVGRIKNHHQNTTIEKGAEKGMFEFGGSTICLLFEKDMVEFDNDLIENTLDGYETAIKMGERIGIKK
jgi:phosphatidylserine decarboxylase